MRFAPPTCSSAGWNAKRTRAGERLARRAAATSAIASAIATWPSWPQACIALPSSDANGRPVSSRSGSPSMSARQSRFGPGRAPRTSAVTPVSATARTSSSADAREPLDDHALRVVLLRRKLGVLVQVAAHRDDVVDQRLHGRRADVAESSWRQRSGDGDARS